MKNRALPFIQLPENGSLDVWAFITNGLHCKLKEKLLRIRLFGCSKIIGGKWLKREKFQNGAIRYA